MNDEQFNVIVDLISTIKTSTAELHTRIYKLDSKIDETRKELKTDINNLRTELKEEITLARKEAKSDNQKLKRELTKEINDVRADVKKLQETVEQNEIVNRSQHSFLIDLIEDKFSKCIQLV